MPTTEQQSAIEDRAQRVQAAKISVEQSLSPDLVQQILQGERLAPEKAQELDPHGELAAHLIRAHTRKEIALLLHDQEKDLPASLREVLEAAEIGEYYDYSMGLSGIKGHVDVVHGTAPSEEIKAWCKEHKVVDYEAGVNEIGRKVGNNMIFKKSRIAADVNNLPANTLTSIRSEKTVLTEEYNLHGVKSERLLTRDFLKNSGNLDEQGKAKNPYLAIYLHGKADSSGHDFEIAAKQIDGTGPIDPLLAFWIKESLMEKTKEKGLKNANNEDVSVNVVTSPGAYSGNLSLTKMRHGDGLFDFKGFGENFQALQLEVGRHVRNNYKDQLGEILNELLAEFSSTFKSESDLKPLEERYRKTYEENIQRERSELLSRKKILFTSEVAEGEIGLSEALRNHFDVETGDQLKVNGEVLKVKGMTKDSLRQGYTIRLNPKFENLIGENLEAENL